MDKDNRIKDRDNNNNNKKKPVRARKERTSAAEYLRGVRTEIKKVVWPSKKELTSFTIVVIIACTFFALLFSTVDTVVLAALQSVLGISLG